MLNPFSWAVWSSYAAQQRSDESAKVDITDERPTPVPVTELGHPTNPVHLKSVPAFRVNNFDLIRLFAATQVLVFHTIERLHLVTPVWLEPFSALHGVPIFFVISGFLVSGSYERAANLKHYARARALRIYPALWLVVTITAVLVAMLGYHILTVSGAAWYVAQLVGVIYTPASLQHFGVGSYNGSLWTIPIELQFYIVLPALYWAARVSGERRGVWLAVFAVWLVIAVALGIAFPRGADAKFHGVAKFVDYTFARHIYLFIFGILLQKAHSYRHWAIAGKAGLWLPLAFLLNYAIPQDSLLAPLGYLVLGVAAISAAYTLPTLAENILREQDISYGMYIYHGMMINVLIALGLSRHDDVFLWVFVGTLVCALLSWRFVERPVLKLKILRRPALIPEKTAAPPPRAG